MQKILNFLEGKKTYIGAFVYGISAFLFALKVIDQDLKNLIDGVAQAIIAVGIYGLIKRGFNDIR